MPVLYTHLMPATFGGRARMNVANTLAAAAAAWASGAHLHDIRQGLRTFTTSFFQAPGRLNLVEVAGTRVVIDYCHNVDGMRRLSDFVNRMMAEPQTRAGVLGASGAAVAHPPRTGRAIGVIGIPGDRRDDDQFEYGALAGTAFDEIYIREDANLRGREPGVSAANVANGVESARDNGGGRDDEGREDPRRGRGGPGGDAAGGAGRPRGRVRRRRGRGVSRGDDARGARPGRDGVADPGELEAPDG